MSSGCHDCTGPVATPATLAGVPLLACCVLQVHTNYEDGVHAVLFSSVPDHDVKPEWVERARARTQSVSRLQGWAMGCIDTASNKAGQEGIGQHRAPQDRTGQDRKLLTVAGIVRLSAVLGSA